MDLAAVVELPRVDLTQRRLGAHYRGHELYKMRKTIVKPVFGQFKEIRGFRRFLLRGLEQVSAEYDLVALTHNLIKMFRHVSTWPVPA